MINGTNLTDNSLLVSLLFNVSLLLLAATILTEIKPMRRLLKLQDRTLGNQLLLAVLFGMIAITNTYAGIEIQGAVVNTRVISTTVAGTPRRASARPRRRADQRDPPISL